MPGNDISQIPPTREAPEGAAELEAKAAELEARREAEIRADERQRLAAELRSVIGDPAVLRDWRRAHGLDHVSANVAVVATDVLRAVAGDIGSRLGGYTPDQPLTADGAEPLLDPDCRDGKHTSCVGDPCECPCHKKVSDDDDPAFD